jgi:hypothetical protein
MHPNAVGKGRGPAEGMIFRAGCRSVSECAFGIPYEHQILLESSGNSVSE